MADTPKNGNGNGDKQVATKMHPDTALKLELLRVLDGAESLSAYIATILRAHVDANPVEITRSKSAPKVNNDKVASAA